MYKAFKKEQGMEEEFKENKEKENKENKENQNSPKDQTKSLQKDNKDLIKEVLKDSAIKKPDGINGRLGVSIIPKDEKYRTNSVLVQKYLESPLLYYGRKFDVRLWVFLNQDMDLFIFK